MCIRDSFAPVIAQDLGVGMTMVRKKGKLPGELLEAAATIEYGASELTLSPDGIEGKRVLVIDDVLATGGTAGAVADLLTRAGSAPGGQHVVDDEDSLPLDPIG